MEKLRVLVVEDGVYKKSRIERIFSAEGIRGKIEATYVTNVVDAKKTLANRKVDLMLLDIQIPNIEGEQPNKLGGIELLHTITKHSEYFCPPNIIGVTAYDDIYAEAKAQFDEYLSALILAKYSEASWEESLGNCIQRLIEAKIEISAFSRGEYQYEICVVCALQDTEFESIKTVLDDIEELRVPNDPTRYITGTMEGSDGKVRVAAAFARDMGLVAAANLATKMIYVFAPANLFMTGITAGVREHVKIGDVIVADPAWDCGQGKYAVQDGKKVFLAAPSQLRLDVFAYNNICQLREEKDLFTEIAKNWRGGKIDSPPNMHIGPSASGAAVIADEERMREILSQHRKLLGIDMELYAVHWACEHTIRPKPLAITFKGVSDYADIGKSDSNRPYAAYVSNQIMRAYVKRFVSTLKPG